MGAPSSNRVSAPPFEVLRRRHAASGAGNTALVVAAAAAAVVAAVVFAWSLLADAGVTVQGSALAVATFGLAFALRRAFAAAYPQLLVAEEREVPLARAGDIAGVQPLGRRVLLVRLVAAAAGVFGLTLLAPIASLGRRRADLDVATPWRRGVRLVDEDGSALRAGDVIGAAIAWPEHGPRVELASVIVVRLGEQAPEEPTNLDWVVDGDLVAYSKICTHAGCPVGLFQADRGHLFCPCHQATFDAARGATPIFGPAARALPQLPLGTNADGELVALGDFVARVGPTVGVRDRQGGGFA